MANKTPEERSELLQKTERKARRTYRKATKRRAMDAEQIQFAKDIIVPLKVVGGYSNLQIGLIVGISKGQVAELLKDENLQRRIVKLKADLPKAALDLMQVYLIEAVQAVVHVMRTSKDNTEVLKAAAEIFDRAGMPKFTKSEQTSKLDVTEPDEHDVFQKLREASPEVQAKAAELRDFFEDGLRTLLTGEGKVEADGPT